MSVHEDVPRELSSQTSTAMDLRISWLEYLLNGSPSTILPSEPSNTTTQSKADTKDVPPSLKLVSSTAGAHRRTLELEDKFRDALAKSGHDGLKRFAAGYSSYSALLFPANPPHVSLSITDLSLPSSSSDAHSKPEPNPNIQSALLPYNSKVDLISSASLDLVELERGLREVEILVKRGMAGSGGLAGYQALLPRLQAVQARHAQNLVIQKTKQKAVTSILGQYNEYVSTMSTLFVGLHQQIEEMEATVLRAEKRKRDLEQETY